MKKNNENLIAFLYILMRDYLPTGDVVQIIKDYAETGEEITEFVFTSKHLEAYANMPEN